MQIRQAEQKDADALLLLDQVCFSDCWKEADWKSFLISEQYKCFIIEKTDPLGFLLVSYAADEGEIIKIGVSPKERKSGYAGQLLKTGFCYLETKGVEKIFLEVRESNIAARTLYEKMGFQEVGIRKKYYHDPIEHAVVYRKNVNSSVYG